MTIGERMRILRGTLTQEQLADRAGVSLSLIQKLEQGARHTASTATLTKIAVALDTDLGTLMGQRDYLARSSDEPDAPGLADVRAVLTAPGWYGWLPHTAGTDDDPPTPQEMAAARTRIGALWRAADLPNLVRALPEAISTGVRAIHGTRRAYTAAAAVTLTEIYQLGAVALAITGRQDLALIAAERAARTLDDVDDDGTLRAALAYWLSWVYLRQSRNDEAERVVLQAASELEPRIIREDQLALWGTLVLRAAVAAARAERGDDAFTHARAAQEAAARIGVDVYRGEEMFGPATVTAMRIEMHAALGDYDAALAECRRLPDPLPDTIPPRNRARWLMNVALAQCEGQPQDLEKPAETLMTAARLAPEWVRHQAIPQQVTLELLERRRRSVPQPLAAIAEHLGINPYE